MRPALDVPDPVSPQLLLEFRRSPPGGVLPPLIGQRFPRHSVLRHRLLECLHHQRRLAAATTPADHEARMVVHERRQVHPLVPAQEEREDSDCHSWFGSARSKRLSPLPLRPRLALRQQSFLVQDPPHLVGLTRIAGNRSSAALIFRAPYSGSSFNAATARRRGSSVRTFAGCLPDRIGFIFRRRPSHIIASSDARIGASTRKPSRPVSSSIPPSPPSPPASETPGFARLAASPFCFLPLPSLPHHLSAPFCRFCPAGAGSCC